MDDLLVSYSKYSVIFLEEMFENYFRKYFLKVWPKRSNLKNVLQRYIIILDFLYRLLRSGTLHQVLSSVQTSVSLPLALSSRRSIPAFFLLF